MDKRDNDIADKRISTWVAEQIENDIMPLGMIGAIFTDGKPDGFCLQYFNSEESAIIVLEELLNNLKVKRAGKPN